MEKTVFLESKKAMSASHVLHTHPEMFYLLASEGDCAIINANDAFKDYTSHIRPKYFSEIVGVEVELEDVDAALKKAKKKKPDPVKFYCQVRSKSGSFKFVEWYVWNYSGLYHFSGQKIMDSSNRTTIEFERMDALLEDFKHALEHDFGQPLTSLKGVIRLALGESNPKEKEQLLKLVEETTDKVIEEWGKISNRIHRKLKP